MWNRSRLKENAKMSLGSGIFKPRWLMALLVVFIVSIIGGSGISLPDFSSLINLNYNTTYNFTDDGIFDDPYGYYFDEYYDDYYFEDNYDEYYDEYYSDDYYDEYYSDDYYDDYYYDEYYSDEYYDDYSVFDEFFDLVFDEAFGVATFAAIGVILVIILIAWIIFVVYSIFVGNIIQVGMSRYFLANRDLSVKDAPSLGLLFSGFKKGQYGNIAKAMAWRMLFLFLWGLIPLAGWIMVAIKTYAYSLVPYIMADNPNIGYKQALKMSKEMTYGHKWDMFVLDLSFIGWYIVGWLACCVGVLFVMPYHQATYAELYDVLKKISVSNGKYPPEDYSMDRQGLNLNVPYIFNPYYARTQYNPQPQYNQYNPQQHNPNPQQHNPNPQQNQYYAQPQHNPNPGAQQFNINTLPQQPQYPQTDVNGQENENQQ